MSESQNELEMLFPEGKTVSLKGEDITIKPFKFGQMPKVMKVVKKLMTAVQGQPIGPALAVDISIEGGDDLIVLMAECIGKDVLFVGTLEQDEGVALTLAFLEVNADFFIKKVWPMIKGNIKLPSPQAGHK